MFLLVYHVKEAITPIYDVYKYAKTEVLHMLGED